MSNLKIKNSEGNWISIPIIKGDPGSPGSQGEKGEQGETGASGKSAYDIWIEQGNTGTEAEFLATLKGEKGDTGENGETGTSGTLINIGTTTTTEPGTEAKVEYTGTETEKTLNFFIPKGEKGETGEVDISMIEEIVGSLEGLETTAKDNIVNAINELANKTKETEWTLVPLADGYTSNALASSGEFMYKRVGKTVFLRGSVKGFTEADSTFATLPVGFRPPARHDLFVGNSTGYFAKGIISPSGNVVLVYDSRETYNASNWYAFCTTFETEEEFPT